MVSMDMMCNSNSKGVSGGGSTFDSYRCTTYGTQHLGNCIASTDGCFKCIKKAHNMRDFPTLKVKGKETNQAPQDGPNPNAQKKNHFMFYKLTKEKSQHKVPGES